MSHSQPQPTPNSFFPTLKRNVDNEEMSDASFRDFVRKSIAGMSEQPTLSLAPYGFGASAVVGDRDVLTFLEYRLALSSKVLQLAVDVDHTKRDFRADQFPKT